MHDTLLLLHGVMKVMLVIGVMVLVATAPSRASASSHQIQTGPAHSVALHEDDSPTWGRRMLHATDDDRWLEPDDQPFTNLDGTPMAGDIDLDGNFFGDC
jgi:hypothetical protein